MPSGTQPPAQETGILSWDPQDPGAPLPGARPGLSTAGRPSHGPDSPPTGTAGRLLPDAPPNPGAEMPLCPAGQGGTGGGQAGEPPAAQVSSPPGCQAPSSHPRKRVGATSAPGAPQEGQGLVFEAQREGAGPRVWPTTPRWQSLQGRETVPRPSQPSDHGKGFQGPGRQDGRAQGTQRDLLLSGDRSSTVMP